MLQAPEAPGVGGVGGAAVDALPPGPRGSSTATLAAMLPPPQDVPGQAGAIAAGGVVRAVASQATPDGLLDVSIHHFCMCMFGTHMCFMRLHMCAWCCMCDVYFTCCPRVASNVVVSCEIKASFILEI